MRTLTEIRLADDIKILKEINRKQGEVVRELEKQSQIWEDRYRIAMYHAVSLSFTDLEKKRINREEPLDWNKTTASKKAKRKYALGKLSGTSSLEENLKRMGMHFTPEDIVKVETAVKEYTLAKKQALEGKGECEVPLFDPKSKYTCGVCGTLYNDECDCICKQNKEVCDCWKYGAVTCDKCKP